MPLKAGSHRARAIDTRASIIQLLVARVSIKDRKKVGTAHFNVLHTLEMALCIMTLGH